MITPHGKHDRLGNSIGIKGLYLKREDLHPYGSHKGRSIPFMIDRYRSEGVTRFAISSSGNAALAAMHHVQNLNRQFPEDAINLSIYIGKNINPEKENLLRRNSSDSHITITKAERPKQMLIAAEKSGVRSLRQSTNDLALTGYFDLARELNTIPNLSAVFVATSSGTTAEALLRAFGKIAPHTAVHMVQTSECAAIARESDPALPEEEPSIADAIVDAVALRRDKLLPYFKKQKAFAWAVTNNEIMDAQKSIRELAGITVSPNGALAFAGLKKAKRHGFFFNGSVVCIVGGK